MEHIWNLLDVYRNRFSKSSSKDIYSLFLFPKIDFNYRLKYFFKSFNFWQDQRMMFPLPAKISLTLFLNILTACNSIPTWERIVYNAQMPHDINVIMDPGAATIRSDYGAINDLYWFTRSKHIWIDIVLPWWYPVIAAHDWIVSTWYTDIWWYYVKITNDKINTIYRHLSKMLVEDWIYVRRWDKIWLVWSTWKTNTPHLHFELWSGNRVDNPHKYWYNGVWRVTCYNSSIVEKLPEDKITYPIWCVDENR